MRNAPAADVDVRGVSVLRAVRRHARVGRAEARLFFLWCAQRAIHARQEDTYVHRCRSSSNNVVPGVRSRARSSVAP